LRSLSVPAIVSDVIIRLPHPLIVDWMLWQHAARRSDRDIIVERVRAIMQFANEIDGSPVTAQPIEIVRWLAQHSDWSQSTNATYYGYLQSWFSWLCLMDHRADNPMLELASPQDPMWRNRAVDIVDQELRLLATVRATARALGGKPTTTAVDQLLDERLDILTEAGTANTEQ
jgi:site-specific recombinase XerD